MDIDINLNVKERKVSLRNLYLLTQNLVKVELYWKMLSHFWERNNVKWTQSQYCD